MHSKTLILALMGTISAVHAQTFNADQNFFKIYTPISCGDEACPLNSESCGTGLVCDLAEGHPRGACGNWAGTTQTCCQRTYQMRLASNCTDYASVLETLNVDTSGTAAVLSDINANCPTGMQFATFIENTTMVYCCPSADDVLYYSDDSNLALDGTIVAARCIGALSGEESSTDNSATASTSAPTSGATTPAANSASASASGATNRATTSSSAGASATSKPKTSSGNSLVTGTGWLSIALLLTFGW